MGTNSGRRSVYFESYSVLHGAKCPSFNLSALSAVVGVETTQPVLTKPTNG